MGQRPRRSRGIGQRGFDFELTFFALRLERRRHASNFTDDRARESVRRTLCPWLRLFAFSSQNGRYRHPGAGTWKVRAYNRLECPGHRSTNGAVLWRLRLTLRLLASDSSSYNDIEASRLVGRSTNSPNARSIPFGVRSLRPSGWEH